VGNVYQRKDSSTLWLWYHDAEGKRHHKATGYAAGQEKQAHALLREIERLIATGETPQEGPVTIKRYAKRWLDRRRHRVRTVRDEETRLAKHVFPRLGQMPVEQVRPRHIRDLILDLRQDGKLAPRTIRHVYGTLCTLFRSAITDELIDSNPCVLDRGILPKNADKDPAWRVGAIFARDEVEQLISNPVILPDRRLLYALKGLAGLRHGEAAGLRWRHYDARAEPLGRLVVACSYTRDGTKTEVTREVPIHPTLAAMLAEWRLEGWNTV
jgi:integrase